MIIKAFVEPGGNVVTADTTFVEYKIVSQVNGRKVITVPLRYFKYDLEAMRRKVDQETRVVFISNPNNPTGTYVTRQEVELFLKGLPPDVLVVLDEAYDTFIDVDDFPNGSSYIKEANVVVLKTFSKAYGLAGLRVGYALTRPEYAAYMETARQPFNVNLLAQAAAIAALDDKKFLKKTRKVVLEGKGYLYGALRKLGLAFVPSVANFILIDAGKDGVGVFREMLKYGVIIRDMKQYGLKNFIRVTIGTKKENERFIKVLKKIL
jgi:histidinol-phosphate aminotransferase